jgi:3-hydroxyisobutyrate dehydrogenase
MAQAVGALAAGTAGSPMVGMMAQRMLAGDFEPRFVARLMVKDMAYADGLLAQCGVDSAIAKAAKARFADADAQGFGEMDLSAVVLPLLREKNGS